MVLFLLQQAALIQAWLIPVVVACVLFFGAPAWAGQPYDFSLTELTTEEELDLELLTDGKPLIVHVWAIDCPHCKLHMPYVAALYKKLDFDEVNFIGSSGIGKLLLFYKKFTAKGGKVSIINLNKEISALFKAIKLDKLFNI